MTNGLIKGRVTVFKKNGSTAFQGYNDKFCGKIFMYYRINGVYTTANEWKVEFVITEDSLNEFADQYLAKINE